MWRAQSYSGNERKLSSSGVESSRVLQRVIDAGLVIFVHHIHRETRGTSLGGAPREQTMLNGELPRVIYHQVYLSIRRKAALNTDGLSLHVFRRRWDDLRMLVYLVVYDSQCTPPIIVKTGSCQAAMCNRSASSNADVLIEVNHLNPTL